MMIQSEYNSSALRQALRHFSINTLEQQERMRNASKSKICSTLGKALIKTVLLVTMSLMEI